MPDAIPPTGDPKLPDAQLLTFADQTNKYVTEYIKLADTKAVAVIAATGIAMGTLGTMIAKILSAQDHINACILYSQYGLITIASGCFASAFWFAFHSQWPRLDSGQISLFSFPDIASQDYNSYVKGVKNLTASSVIDQVCKQNHNLSTITKTKFTLVVRSIKCLLSGIIVIIALSATMLFLTPQIFLTQEKTPNGHPTSPNP